MTISHIKRLWPIFTAKFCVSGSVCFCFIFLPSFSKFAGCAKLNHQQGNDRHDRFIFACARFSPRRELMLSEMGLNDLRQRRCRFRPPGTGKRGLNNFAYISFWSARFLPPVVGGDKRTFQMTFYCRRERSRSLRLARFGRGNGFRGSMCCRGTESENAKRDIVIRIDNSSAGWHAFRDIWLGPDQ